MPLTTRGASNMARKKFAVGDQIKFKAATRGSFRAAVRVVQEIDELGRPLVRYEGWSSFVVRHDEILAVLPRQPQ
jgi:hypothetical protein